MAYRATWINLCYQFGQLDAELVLTDPAGGPVVRQSCNWRGPKTSFNAAFLAAHAAPRIDDANTAYQQAKDDAKPTGQLALMRARYVEIQQQTQALSDARDQLAKDITAFKDQWGLA